MIISDTYAEGVAKVHRDIECNHSRSANKALVKMGLAKPMPRASRGPIDPVKRKRPYNWRMWGRTPQSNSLWVEFRAMQAMPITALRDLGEWKF